MDTSSIEAPAEQARAQALLESLRRAGYDISWDPDSQLICVTCEGPPDVTQLRELALTLVPVRDGVIAILQAEARRGMN